MGQEAKADLLSVLDGIKWPSMLGSSEFIDQIKQRFFQAKNDPEVPQGKELAPTSSEIISRVCGYFGVKQADLFQTRRGQFNEPRNVALFLIRQVRHESLSSIGRQFKMDKYSSVSSAIERLKMRVGKDPDLAKRVSYLQDTLIHGNKSQGQT